MADKSRLSLRIRTSVYLAFAGGIITPALETVRRWRQIPDPHYFVNWFDDYLIGGFLLWAAWRAVKAAKGGPKLLMVAWGFAAGMAFSSFLFQAQHLDNPDPTQANPVIIVLVKGLMVGVCILGIILSYGE